MKIQILIIVLTLLTSCSQNENKHSTNIKQEPKTPSMPLRTYPDSSGAKNWQQGFGLTHNPKLDTIWYKPVEYYLSDKECSSLAKDFYYGKLRPSDDSLTKELLKLSATKNSKLRPFYRWCLNKTILIQDGALAEYTGQPARLYSETFPKEFFEYMNIDTSGQKYIKWTGSIAYSGYYENEDYKNKKVITEKIIQKMKTNCKSCESEKIEKFANDCFH